MQFSYFSGS